MCIDVVEINFGIANGVFDRVVKMVAKYATIDKVELLGNFFLFRITEIFSVLLWTLVIKKQWKARK